MRRTAIGVTLVAIKLPGSARPAPEPWNRPGLGWAADIAPPSGGRPRTGAL